MFTETDRAASPPFGSKTERKRNVDDRRQNAMAALRAQRDARATRTEHKQRKRIQDERDKDKDDDMVSFYLLSTFIGTLINNIRFYFDSAQEETDK